MYKARTDQCVLFLFRKVCPFFFSFLSTGQTTMSRQEKERHFPFRIIILPMLLFQRLFAIVSLALIYFIDMSLVSMQFLKPISIFRLVLVFSSSSFCFFFGAPNLCHLWIDVVFFPELAKHTRIFSADTLIQITKLKLKRPKHKKNIGMCVGYCMTGKRYNHTLWCL